MKSQKKRIDILFYSIALTFVTVILLLGYPHVIRKALYPKKYSEYVSKYSEIYGVDSGFCYAVIKAESNFDKNAVSRSGAVGLMQLTLPTAVYIAERLGETISEEALKNPDINIKYGIYYINYLARKFIGSREVLAAYNAGEGRVSEWLNDKRYSSDGISLTTTPYKETNDYIKKTLKYYGKYKSYYA